MNVLPPRTCASRVTRNSGLRKGCAPDPDSRFGLSRADRGKQAESGFSGSTWAKRRACLSPRVSGEPAVRTERKRRFPVSAVAVTVVWLMFGC